MGLIYGIYEHNIINYNIIINLVVFPMNFLMGVYDVRRPGLDTPRLQHPYGSADPSEVEGVAGGDLRFRTSQWIQTSSTGIYERIYQNRFDSVNLLLYINTPSQRILFLSFRATESPNTPGLGQVPANASRACWVNWNCGERWGGRFWFNQCERLVDYGGLYYSIYRLMIIKIGRP